MNNKPDSVTHYPTVSVILHWAMALAFVAMLASGILMTGDVLPKKLTFQMYQWHKSLGVILLLLFFVRIFWRLTHKVPALPESFSKPERFAAKLGHFGFYVLMFSIPMAGWIMVSSSPYGISTYVFDVFKWPHIGFVEGNSDIYKISKEVHEILGYVFIGVITLHVSAVIKHGVLKKENLLLRIWFKKND